MTSHVTSRPTWIQVLLSSSFSAACLNLGTSALGHPRGLASAVDLGLPLCAAFVVLLAGAAPFFGLIRALVGRLGRVPTALDAAWVVAFVLTAALLPLVEVGLREASGERAAVVLSCALGFVLTAALAGTLFVGRQGEREEALGKALCYLPPATFFAALALWLGEFHVLGTPARAGLGAAGLAAIVACVRWSPRLGTRSVVRGSTLLALLAGALGALSSARPACTPQASVSTRPPVILITVDTLRADRVLGDGPARVATPAIDRLAADSVVFTNTRSAAPWTKPALATILTGLPPPVHGMTTRRARMPEEVETLAERLQAAGYHTGGVGLNAHLERAFRFDQGFDDYAIPARLDCGIGLGVRVLGCFFPERFPELFPSTQAIADVAVGWLDAHAREPLFLWLHVLDPHWPYEPPAQWVERPEVEPRRWGDPTMVTNVQAGNTKPWPAERQRVAELYAGEIRYVDASLARVLDELRELGLYERALIVLCSDHGEEFWEHGRYEHGHTLYDEVLHVPLFFKLPGAGARARLDAPVSTQALVPTVLDVLGIPFDPATLASRSLAALWQQPATAQGEPLFSSGTYYFGEKCGVVFDGMKLVLELDTRRCELYDLARDPEELHSLVAAERDTMQRGLALLEEWHERCRALRASLGIEDPGDAAANEEISRLMQGLGYTGRE